MRLSKLTFFRFLFVAVVCIPILITNKAHAQDSEFEKWKNEQQSEFKAYRDKFDKEFIEMLEQTWEEVGINKGSDFYKKEKPVTIPTAPPRPVVENDVPVNVPTVKDFIEIDIPELEEKPPIKIELPDDQSIFGGLVTKNISIDYFSSTIPLEYPVKLREFFRPGDFSSDKTDSKKIADFWDKASSINHTPLITYSNEIRAELGLNDWGYVLLLNKFSNNIFKGYDKKLINLYNWFLLTKAGYKVRVGYDQNGIYTLFSVAYDIFNTQYYTLDGERYYVISLNENKQTPSSIFTYSGSHQAQNRKLDLRITEFPNLGDSKSIANKTLSFSYGDIEYTIPITIDKNLITYFEYFPLTELPIFFSASLTESSKNSIYKVLGPAIADMSEKEAVNFILRFVQTSFDYKTDQDHFDREKYMLPDETLFYQYSDCDDRAILFANLVEDLLKLDVVGLRYSKHLATAVLFNSPVTGDSHSYLGKEYVVADPTYINASVGMTMSQFKNEKPEIVTF